MKRMTLEDRSGTPKADALLRAMQASIEGTGRDGIDSDLLLELVQRIFITWNPAVHAAAIDVLVSTGQVRKQGNMLWAVAR